MDASEFKSRFLPCHRRMFWTALRLTHNRQDAEDLVQDTFTKLWERRNELPATDRLDAYCNTIVHNLFIDRQRRERLQTIDRDATEHPLTDNNDISKRLEQEEERTIVMQLICQLPEKQRQIITMHDVDALTYEEIARQTGQTDINIRVLLSRARKTIREQFRKTNTWTQTK